MVYLSHWRAADFVHRLRQPARILVLCLLVSVANPTPLGASPFGNALSFNGTSQAVVITNFGNIMPTNEITIEFWAYTTQAANQSAFAVNILSTADRVNAHINYGNAGETGSIYWDF